MKNTNISSELYDYIVDCSLREHPVLRELREDTAANMMLANMQVSPLQAQFMQMLMKLVRAKNVLELGTFTGYSALAMALALPENGKLITCDINPEWTNKAHYFWQKAGVADKIELKLAPAIQSLNQLIQDGHSQQFDFIFIDADKTRYVEYYELALKLVSPGGLIAIDNIFWDGKVVDATDTGAQTREIKRLNALIKQDERVDISLLTVADGLFLIRLR